GNIRDPIELSDLRTAGLFAVQKALLGKVLFESFTTLAATPDGAPFTLGISNVRESDSAQSPPLIITFVARHVSERSCVLGLRAAPLLRCAALRRQRSQVRILSGAPDFIERRVLALATEPVAVEPYRGAVNLDADAQLLAVGACIPCLPA